MCDDDADWGDGHGPNPLRRVLELLRVVSSAVNGFPSSEDATTLSEASQPIATRCPDIVCRRRHRCNSGVGHNIN